MTVFASVGIIILCASVVQGAIGFGFSLLSVPLLLLCLPPSVVVPVIVLCSLGINLMVAVSALRYIDLRRMWLMIFFGIAGIPPGVYALKVLDADILKGSTGIVISLTAVLLLLGYQVRMKNRLVSYGIAGALSGFLNGCLSMSGPPIVVFLTNEGCGKQAFRANLAFYFIILNVITAVVLIFNGMIGMEILLHTGIGTVSLLIGSTLGILLAGKLPELLFRRIVLSLLIVMGAMNLFSVLY